MKTKLFLLLTAGLFCCFACSKEFDNPENDLDPALKSGIAGVGTIVTETVHSSALEGNLAGLPADRNVKIYLPKSYETSPEKRFPVIYFLHGVPSLESMLMEPAPFEIFFQVAQLQARVDFPESGFENWVNDLIDNGGMREVIIVMPDARTLFGPCIYQNSELLGNFEDYMVNDVVNYIDAHYRTIPHFNWRALTGHCAGGYGALQIAMKYPHVFRNVGGLSPAHFPEPTMLAMAGIMPMEDALWESYGAPAGPMPYNPFQPFKFANNTAYALAQAWLPNLSNPPYYCDLPFTYVDGNAEIIPELMAKVDAQSLFALAAVNVNGLKKLKSIYFDCGENDDLGMYEPNVMFHEHLETLKIKHNFESYPGTHLSNLYERLGKLWVELSNDFPKEE